MDLLLSLGFGTFSAAEIKNKLVLPVLAAMLPSVAYPRGHKRTVYLLCYLTGILHLCLSALLFLPCLCDLESEQEAYALLNTPLYKTVGVGRQGGRGENYFLLFPLPDSCLELGGNTHSILKDCASPAAGAVCLTNLSSLECFMHLKSN